MPFQRPEGVANHLTWANATTMKRSISVLDYEKLVVNDDWTNAFQKAIDDAESQYNTIFVPARKTQYKVGKLYVSKFLSIFGENTGYGHNLHYSDPNNATKIKATDTILFTSKVGTESVKKYIDIQNLSFDNENSSTVFTDILMTSSIIKYNRIRNFHTIFQCSIEGLSEITNNMCLNIRGYFMKFSSSPAITDSRVCNNYINGSTSVNNAIAFDLYNPNQSIIDSNFIDYFHTAFKIEKSIGLNVSKNDIQLCGIIIDSSDANGILFTGNKCRWISKNYANYWTSQGVSVSNFGVNGDWCVAKIGGTLRNMTIKDNFFSVIDNIISCTSRSVSSIIFRYNQFDTVSTAFTSLLGSIESNETFADGSDFYDCHKLTSAKQPFIVNNNDRKLYPIGYTQKRNNVILKNNDDGLLLKNPSGKNHVADTFTQIVFTTKPSGMSVTSDTIQCDYTGASTAYVWAYSDSFTLKADTDYILEFVQLTTALADIQIQYYNGTSWVSVGVKTNRNNFEVGLRGTSTTQYRIAFVGEKLKTYVMKLPKISEVL